MWQLQFMFKLFIHCGSVNYILMMWKVVSIKKKKNLVIWKIIKVLLTSALWCNSCKCRRPEKEIILSYTVYFSSSPLEITHLVYFSLQLFKFRYLFFMHFTVCAQNRLLKNEWIPLFHIHTDCGLTERQTLAFLSYVLHGSH